MLLWCKHWVFWNCAWCLGSTTCTCGSKVVYGILRPCEIFSNTVGFIGFKDIFSFYSLRELAGHPGGVKMLSLVKQRFICQWQQSCIDTSTVVIYASKSNQWVTQRPFNTLNPLHIPAGPWTDINYNIMTGLLLSNTFNSILAGIDWLANMVHLVACIENMGAKQLDILMLKLLWKVHKTPKIIFWNPRKYLSLAGHQVTQQSPWVSDYSCLQLFIWGLMEDQRLPTRPSRIIYIILHCMTKMIGNPYCQQLSFGTIHRDRGST